MIICDNHIVIVGPIEREKIRPTYKAIFKRISQCTDPQMHLAIIIGLAPIAIYVVEDLQSCQRIKKKCKLAS